MFAEQHCVLLHHAATVSFEQSGINNLPLAKKCVPQSWQERMMAHGKCLTREWRVSSVNAATSYLKSQPPPPHLHHSLVPAGGFDKTICLQSNIVSCCIMQPPFHLNNQP